MLQLRDGVDTDMNDNGSGEHDDGADSGGECMSHDEICKKLDDLKSCPLEAGELQIVSLGKSCYGNNNIVTLTKVCLIYYYTCCFLLCQA